MTIFGNRVNATSASIGVEVEETSTELIKENTLRAGLQVVNASSASVYLRLGGAAEAKKGIFLTANGGSWDGMVGPLVWVGSVFAIATAAKSIVTVTEV